MSYSSMSLFIFLTFIIWQANSYIAYDRSNHFLNIPTNEIHVITDEIDRYRPKMSVQFINFQNLKRKRKGTQTREGKIRIETRLRTIKRVKTTVENVEVDKQKIMLRFGGGSRAHYPYNRVVDYRRDLVEETTVEATTVPSTTIPIPIIPSKWATEATISPNYSAEPALFLPSRFHRKENVVIVFKKHGME